jgi:hypothetical protein
MNKKSCFNNTLKKILNQVYEILKTIIMKCKIIILLRTNVEEKN